MRSLFAALDVDADDELSYAEITASVVPRLLYLEAPSAGLDAFEELDADGDGVISVRDLAVRAAGGWRGQQARCTAQPIDTRVTAATSTLPPHRPAQGRTTPALAAAAVDEAAPGAGGVSLGEFLDILAAGEAHDL